METFAESATNLMSMAWLPGTKAVEPLNSLPSAYIFIFFAPRTFTEKSFTYFSAFTVKPTMFSVPFLKVAEERSQFSFSVALVSSRGVSMNFSGEYFS